MTLLERKRIGAPELARMFEVSTRTIYRDIESLAMAGVPVFAWRGSKGGIGIAEGYKIDEGVFTASDIGTLLTGLDGFASLMPGGETARVLPKIRRLIPPEQVDEIRQKTERFVVDPTPWRRVSSTQALLKKITHALNERQLLTFAYADREGRKSERCVEPCQLLLKEMHWYLHGYCRMRDDFRLFKLSRIADLKVADERFEPRPLPPVTSDFSDRMQEREIEIDLLIEASLQATMADLFGEVRLVPREDSNRFHVRVSFIESDLGYGMLLSLGDKCECLGPPHVRTELLCRIDRMRAVYVSK